MREHREAAGLSLELCAAKLGYDPSALSRFENAKRAVPPDVPEKLDVLFNTGRLFTVMYRMIKHDVHPGRYRLSMEYEDVAIQIAEYAGQVMPGLLQTPDYARSLLRAGRPDATDDELSDLVAARMGRQAILARDVPPIYSAVLDEAVLCRPVGSHAIMRDQLARILPLCDGARTTIRVLPFEHGEHPLLGGLLVLLTLPDGKVGAWVEGSNHGQMLEHPDLVRERQRAYDRVSAYSLPTGQSADLIKTAMERYAA
ncbi:helix-turn-helix transcriptional regulator [Streptomyces sp. SID3343]|uniref:helix-turn-helix domain-containing protein n=1 Tax=Streptomyces sp. SID3343 TaxID=2690260 RepID=UPI00136A1E27|nr:helix-turn-helix transcriptional regulator [Streptomyces sp. SID3343]MYV97038.1 helix-turn-helix domain-containing protein [Streptomyces sp. SID3343]